MNIDDIRPDMVLHFRHAHNTTPEKAVVVLEVNYDEKEVRILSATGTTGLAYYTELSEYSPEDFQILVDDGVVLNLYSQRVTRLGKKMFRLGD